MIVIVYLCNEKNATINIEKMKPKKKMTFGIDEYIKANKKLAREEELARNGGRWVAKDRPHKNLKRYDRKRDKKNFDSYLSFSFL